MEIRQTCGYYENPHEAARGHSSEGAEALRHAQALCKAIEQSLADVGKVRYCEVGPGVVDPDVREAAERAHEVFCWWAGPGLGRIKARWISEESAKEREYLEMFPADRGNPEVDDCVFECDSEIAGCAGAPGDPSIYINANLAPAEVVLIVAHELQHKKQSLEMSLEDREADARQVAEEFCKKFFPLDGGPGMSLHEAVYLSRGF